MVRRSKVDEAFHDISPRYTPVEQGFNTLGHPHVECLTERENSYIAWVPT